MTEAQKHMVEKMRTDGYGYAKIATELDLSVNTVKSFCRRSVADTPTHTSACEYCGKTMKQTPKRKRKRFCSDECRLSWWKENRDAMDKKAVYILVCEGCGREYESYGNKNRKYCTIDCYMDARFNREPII